MEPSSRANAKGKTRVRQSKIRIAEENQIRTSIERA